MSEEMINLYKKLNVNEKRNEFSSLLVKTDKLLDELLSNENIVSSVSSKNYDKLENKDMNEEELLLYFYEDLWNIKNKILTLLINKNK